MTKRPQLVNPTKRAVLTTAEIARLRRETMIRLTKQHQVTSVKHMKNLLEKEGFFVALDTISMDFVRANIIRLRSEPNSKTWVYSHVPWVDGDEKLRGELSQSLVEETVRSDLYYFHATPFRIGNVVVVNCDASGGYAIRRSLSSLNWPHIASVIGDFATVWCLCSNIADAELVLRRLQVMSSA